MKRLITALTLAFALVLAIGAVAYAGNGLNGNGAPSGAHYNLNIIGVDNPKNYSDPGSEFDANGGRRIFVNLNSPTKILLTEGAYDVLDYNGTDDGVASFQLPNPDEDGDGTTEYSVFVRALGNPKGYAYMQTCYTDSTGSWCAAQFAGGVAQIELRHNKGTKPTFVNQTKNLLYVDYCRTWSVATPTSPSQCLDVDQIPLFGEDLQEYYWDYDNHGLRLAQLRFYDWETTPTWP